MKSVKSKIRGNLVYTYPSGREVTIVHNELWGVLQRRRTEFIAMGYDKDKLKLKYAIN